MKPLPKEEYIRLMPLLHEVPFNILFARAVAEQIVAGKVWVNEGPEITTAYIVHPYGMTLLLGNPDNETFNHRFREYALNAGGERSSVEWMQTYPRSWDARLPDLLGTPLQASGHNGLKQEHGIVELHTRVNFKFDRTIYAERNTEHRNPGIDIVPVTKEMYRRMEGSVIPRNFWNSEDDFFNRGMAFCLLYKGEPASMAFSSFRFEHQLELGIETLPAFRGMGFAEWVCAALIGYCMEHNEEPIWACRKENTGSYKLALKLGFRPVLELPYYRLPV